jgi:hypothetical protein
MSGMVQAYQYNIEWSMVGHSLLVLLDRNSTVFSNLGLVSVLLQNLDRELLIDLVIFGKQNIEMHVVDIRYGADNVRLQCSRQREGEILSRARCRDLRGNAIVQAPFHYRLIRKEDSAF